MVVSLALLTSLAAGCVVRQPGPAEETEALLRQAALVEAKKVLKDALLVDGHNDLPWAIRTAREAPGDVVAYDLRGEVAGQTDLRRLREGGVGAQFWSVYVPGEGGHYAANQLEQIELARRMIAQYPDTLRPATRVSEIREARRQGRIASLLGMEGGHAIENSMGALRAFYELGVRYMTLTHNTHTDWADSAAETPARHGGLSKFGEQVVREMNRLGMLVDLSHASVETMEDAIVVSKAPVIFSHSAAAEVCPVPRNVPDKVLKRLVDNGGIIMVTFVAGFVDAEVAKVQQPAIEEFNRRVRKAQSEADRQKIYDEIIGNLKKKLPKTSIARVADHIDHIREVAGVQSIGIGADFDGNELWPEGLSDVSMYPNLFAELVRRGWTAADLKLIAGENLLRVMARAEEVAAELQRTEQPSTARLEP
ncbi:MAG: dipeptidase [Nevskiaceae bacterium]